MSETGDEALLEIDLFRQEERVLLGVEGVELATFMQLRVAVRALEVSLANRGIRIDDKVHGILLL